MDRQFYLGRQASLSRLYCSSPIIWNLVNNVRILLVVVFVVVILVALPIRLSSPIQQP